jgi:hypothetical protein
MTLNLQSLPSRQLHRFPRSPFNGVMVGRAGRRPGVFGVVHVDHTLGPLHRITRLIGGMFTRSTFPNQSGSLAKGISDLASPTAPNIPNLRLGRRVLEGREIVAGGETTGSCGVHSVLSRRAPAGAREACDGSQSGPHSPLCGAPSANGHSLTALSPRAEACDAGMANDNAPAFDAPHRGLCGPLSNPTPQPR